ncbi:hypothetical protein HIM_06323 [Hirsutella minnesotensis 3608]|uniref:Uncharacterized protein n=1 Tax=Hirsutella minnesotensis 3608 TaxID=1043627 RepID=A0A0F7ZZJ2_9HYPO|nr:hypothetical protein HIM_06323 [Hirsutella minnesotensis 3608]
MDIKSNNVKSAVEKYWSCPTGRAQRAIKKLEELLDLRVICEPDWSLLGRTLKPSAYSMPADLAVQQATEHISCALEAMVSAKASNEFRVDIWYQTIREEAKLRKVRLCFAVGNL